MNRSRISLCLVALLFPAACDAVSEPPLPSSEAAAQEFISAWHEGDYKAMSGLLSDAVAALRIERWIRRATEKGHITSTDVRLTGSVREFTREELGDGPPPLTPVPFMITYESDAAARPVQMVGELEATLEPATDAGEERWTIEWDRSDMWPGIEGARSFEVTYKWLKRGSILDRTGRPLAEGHAERRRYPQGTLAGTTVGHIEPFQQDNPKGERPDDQDRDQSEPDGKVGDEDTAGDGEMTTSSPSPEESDAEDSKGEEAQARDDDDDELTDEPVVATTGDLVGASGLELGLQDKLAGRPSSKLSVVGRKGKPLEVVGRRSGKPGRDVRTTLDIDVQRAAENAYGGTTGGAIVMDPASGDLLAVVASSPFGPQNYVGVPGIEPFNRALSGLYPPGSSLKVMTGAAALQEGVVKEGTQLNGPSEYKGVRNFESGAFGTLDFATAVKFSVNTAFAQIAEDLGPRRLMRYSDSFGFNRPPEMPLGAATSSFPFPEDEGDVMWSSIGQAQVLATPLQMATVAATIANKGKRMEPRILMSDARTGDRVVSRNVAATMTRLMENVVNGGTGTGANLGGVQVAGKTGTAEVDVDGKRKNHAWFISFAPSQTPKVAVAVVSELGGIGGQVAAPLAGRILSAVLPVVD